MKQSRSRKLRWLGANLCRLVLALTFVFSGVVKLIDPRGTQYKIEDYAVAFGLPALTPHLIPLAMAVALAMLEFYIGFNIFFGIRRRTTTRLAIAMLVVMTPLTLYLAVTNAHMDCGCFGDAVLLSNWQTFAKNLVLLGAAVVAMLNYRRLTRFISERNQWVLSLYALVFALALALYNIRYLPVMDFRPYRVGTDLPKAMMDEWEHPEQMRYADFAIVSPEEGDITMEWLGQPGYKFLLISPHLDAADDGSIEEINAIYDYCQQHGYPFLALTSGNEEAIDRWRDLTGAEYQFAQADGIALKTVVRSNPGLVMLHDGVVFQKWSVNDIPHIESPSLPLEETQLGQMQQSSRAKAVYRLLLWFVVPMLVWTTIDRIWVGEKLYRRHKIHKTIQH